MIEDCSVCYNLVPFSLKGKALGTRLRLLISKSSLERKLTFDSLSE